jgi:1-pyrroline-5-carboxylate dehydrogenase
VATALVRGAFEYQGQKCSAASRVYAPASLWKEIEARVEALTREIVMGDPAVPETFMGAVINAAAFERISGYLALARESDETTVVTGGKGDDTEGFFVEPTLVRTTNPRHRLMTEEIFGPVLTAYVYDDARFEETLEECDSATEYGLTGAIFARDRAAVETAMARLRHAAGNFYVNDKPTGAVVGQQPFGGGRASGTNDKAGAAHNLLRWTSPRAVKETFVPPRAPGYPHQAPGD